MTGYKKRQIILCAGVVLLIAITVTFMGLFLQRDLIRIRQREAENNLFYYNEKIILQLNGTMNEVDELVRMAQVVDSEKSDWFIRAAEPLLEREEIKFVCLFEGNTVAHAFPEDKFGDLVGRDMRDFSYAYTLTKMVRELVVEGPVTLDFDPDKQKVFLFQQAILDGNEYVGEITVALDSDYVLEQLGLADLSAQGYDYELWRVEQQNGAKEVIARSRDSVDFSHAKKVTFYLPSQWNLSIQPVGGWISNAQKIDIIVACALFACILLALAYVTRRLILREHALKRADSVDKLTGLYSKNGFIQELDAWLDTDDGGIMLFYFSLGGYCQAMNLIDPDQEESYLRNLSGRLNEYIHSPFIAGHLGQGRFVVAVSEKMDAVQQEDFAKGLSLEFLFTIQTDREKRFLTARYNYMCCRQNEGRAKDKLTQLIRNYYDSVTKESPVRMMIEKCNQLADDNANVEFEDYTDPDMTELSKSFNRYRKQVEQLAYFDPVFNVGNRQKYFRDAGTLISYDPKRKFNLFCVDICSFSQYNDLFSAEVGDEILQEVLKRMSRPFGSYLYRINGDVFLGISQSEENAEAFAIRLEKMLVNLVTVKTISVPLRVRIVACQYPTHGDTPYVLLERIQAAMNFSKVSDRNVVVYDDELDALLRTDVEILHRLTQAIDQKSLEIWYQPARNLKNGRFDAAEALVKLPDGNGGYFSAGQVVSLAERNGKVRELGEYVLKHACSFMRRRGDSLGLKDIAVNVSVQQLLVENSAEHLLKLIGETGVDPRRVILEITESVLIQSIDHAAQTLERLRQAGIRIALDDFGVGYSSLNYLSNLPVDIIKIDHSLAQQIRTNKKQHMLLKSIVELAAVNDLLVVTEGVETEEDQKLIEAAGVHYIQGYYYARPMPEDALIAFLNEQ